MKLGWPLVSGALLLAAAWACQRAVGRDPVGQGRGTPTTGVSATGPGQNETAAPGASQHLAPPAGLVSAASPDVSVPFDQRVYLVPLSTELPAEDLALVERALGAFYALEVTKLPPVPLPDRALNATRRRYRAEKLLDLLGEQAPRDAFRVLGLTAVDISTTKDKIQDWGILGLATLDGRTCVISRFRTRRGASEPVAQIRFAKTAVHEIGHTLGLEHCPTRGCLMEDARGTVFTTDREYDLCADCREKLQKKGFGVGATRGAIPWPAPW
jgi:archaemetzincin